MEVTSRGYRLIGLATVLLITAVIAAQPLFLAGGTVLALLFVGRQLQYVLALRTLHETLTLEQSLDRDRVMVEDPLETTTTATLAEPSSLTLDFQLRTPVPATSDGADTLNLAAGDTKAQASSTLEFAVAGTYTIPQPRVTVKDPSGYVTTTFDLGDARDVTVEPRHPRNLHVGQGGEQFVTAYGDHPTDAQGTGMDPAELRAYMPGDPANRIDWRATARLNDAFVREFEAETDRRLVLIIDTRPTMAQGNPGQTKLDYARQVGLAYVEASRNHGDPIGYAIIDENGILDHSLPDAGAGHYDTVRQALLDIDPTPRRSGRRRSPVQSLAAADRLRTNETPFATRLRPFLDHAGTDRRAQEPLYAAVQTAVQSTRGTVWTVLLTDASDPAALTDAVNAGRRGDRHVQALLTPSILFDPGGLADLDTAYTEYRAFEELRRDLDGLARVRAFEVAPGDRLDAILARARATQRGES